MVLRPARMSALEETLEKKSNVIWLHVGWSPEYGPLKWDVTI